MKNRFGLWKCDYYYYYYLLLASNSEEYMHINHTRVTQIFKQVHTYKSYKSNTNIQTGIV